MNVTCKNCGAVYNTIEEKHVCPYCGFEDTDRVLNDTKNFINKLDEQTKQYHTLPERVAAKSAFKTSKIFGLIILIAVLGLGVVAIGLGVRNYYKQQKTDHIKAHLEELYQAEDYSGLHDYYYDNLDYTYGESFKKYGDIAYMESILNSIVYYESKNEEYMEKGETKENYQDSMVYFYYEPEIKAAFQILRTCQEEREVYYPFDNKELYDSYEQKIYNLFCGKYGFTEEELLEGIDLFLDGEDLSFYMEKMWENQHEM